MLGATKAIERYRDGVSRDAFLRNSEKQDAVIRRIEILGEAADRLMKADADYAVNFPDLPLRDIKDMRNMVIHGYDAVDVEIIWNTAQSDIAILTKSLEVLSESNTKEYSLK